MCSANPPPCLCSYAAARGPSPPGRGPGRKTLPIRGPGGSSSGAQLLLLRLSETWCPQGPACVTDLRPRRRQEGLTKCRNLAREPLPLLLPVCTGKRTWKLPALGVWVKRCRGGRKQVEAQAGVFRAGGLAPRTPALRAHLRPVILLTAPVGPRAAACGALRALHRILGLVVPVQNVGAQILSGPCIWLAWWRQSYRSPYSHIQKCVYQVAPLRAPAQDSG